jgi:hypothetical protein
VSSNHSRWCSTLRSFSLAFSRSASTASRVRTPSVRMFSGNPSPHGHPARCSATEVRDTANLAFTPLVAGDNALGRSASRAARCRSRFPDLKALIRQRVRSDHQRCSYAVTRCSLGLRPSKVCFIDAVPRHVSASMRPRPPLRTPRCPTDCACEAVRTSVAEACRPLLRRPATFRAVPPAASRPRPSRPDQHLLPRECHSRKSGARCHVQQPSVVVVAW